jgi:hypothetical protein
MLVPNYIVLDVIIFWVVVLLKEAVDIGRIMCAAAWSMLSRTVILQKLSKDIEVQILIGYVQRHQLWRYVVKAGIDHHRSVAAIGYRHVISRWH